MDKGRDASVTGRSEEPHWQVSVRADKARVIPAARQSRQMIDDVRARQLSPERRAVARLQRTVSRGRCASKSKAALVQGGTKGRSHESAATGNPGLSRA